MPLLCAYRGMNSLLKQNATATASPSVSSRFLSYMFNKFFEYFSQILMALVLCLITFFKNLILAFLGNLLQWLRNLFQPPDNDTLEDDPEDPPFDPPSDDNPIVNDETSNVVTREDIEESPNSAVPRTQDSDDSDDSDGVQGPTELPTVTTQGTQATERIGRTLSETEISPIDAQATQLLEQEGGNTVSNVVDFSDLEEIIFSLVEEILSFTIYGIWYGLLKVHFV